MAGTSSRENGVARRHLTGRSDVAPARDDVRGAGSHRRSGEITIIEAMLYVGTLLAAVFLAGLAISAIAAAGETECTNTNSTTTVCQNPGNAQVATSPGVTANNFPYWWWGWNSLGITISIGGGHPHH